jgi:HdeA/HdeB family protein
MRIRFIALSIMALLLPAAANAQVSIDMNTIKCSQYLAMQPATSRAFSSWMSGWFSYQTRKTYVDLIIHEQNIKNVQDWCKYHPNDKVMTGLQNAIKPQ